VFKWFPRAHLGAEPSKGPSEAPEATQNQLDLFDARIRDLEHEWSLASEELTSVRDRVHRELGHITKRTREARVTEEVEEAVTQLTNPGRRSMFYSAHAKGKK